MANKGIYLRAYVFGVSCSEQRSVDDNFQSRANDKSYCNNCKLNPSRRSTEKSLMVFCKMPRVTRTLCESLFSIFLLAATSAVVSFMTATLWPSAELKVSPWRQSSSMLDFRESSWSLVVMPNTDPKK